MSNQGYSQYRRTQAETASPAELITMMYTGAIRFLSLSRQKIEARDLEAANRHLLRGQEIILELMISVDVSAGPVARNLFDLYEFMHRHLIQANVRKDGAMIEEVVQMLRELLPAWEQAVSAARPNVTAMRSAARDAPAMHVASA